MLLFNSQGGKLYLKYKPKEVYYVEATSNSIYKIYVS